jgi:hypothetical protein
MGYRILRHDGARVLERMKLSSTLPLCTGREATAPLPPSVIDATFVQYPDAISAITRTIDTVATTDIARRKIQHRDFLPQGFEHHVTPMRIRHRRKRRPTPAPDAYEPEYQSVYPKVQQTTLPARDGEKEKRPFTPLSTLDVVDLWEHRLRVFEPSEVARPEFVADGADKGRDLTPSSCFRSVSNREIFKNPSPAKNLAPADPPAEKPPVVPELAKQRDRVIPFAKDPGRIYDEAAPQLMKLKSRTPNPPKFEQQTPRDRPEHKNLRVQKLDQLVVEQRRYIDNLSARGSPSVKSSRRDLNENTFDVQKKRSEKVFPSQKVLTGESHWPNHAIDAQKRTQSRVRVPVIHPTGKGLEGEEFWQAKRGYKESVLEFRSNSRIE